MTTYLRRRWRRLLLLALLGMTLTALALVMPALMADAAAEQG